MDSRVFMGNQEPLDSPDAGDADAGTDNIVSCWLMSPGSLSEMAASSRGRAIGFLVLIMARLSAFLGAALVFDAVFTSAGLMFGWFFLDLIPYLVIWVIFVSLFHFEIDACGGKGRSLDLAGIAGLALAPAVLATPLALIFSNSFSWLYPLARFGTMLWSLALLTGAASRLYGVNTSITLIAASVPLFLAGLLSFLFAGAPLMLFTILAVS